VLSLAESGSTPRWVCTCRAGRHRAWQQLDCGRPGSNLVGTSASDVGLASAVGARPLHVGAQTFP
jgi:hypothetical protein